MPSVVALYILLQYQSAHAGVGEVAWDLRWHFINFFILVALIIWKTKGKLRDKFNMEYDNFKKKYQDVSESNAEINKNVQIINDKLENIDMQEEKAMSKMAETLREFEKTNINFVNEHEKKLIKELNKKLITEEKIIAKKTFNLIMGDVVEETKTRIRLKETLQKKISEKLLEEEVGI